MNLRKYQRKLAKACVWNPGEEGLEPMVDINNTAINRIACDLLKETGDDRRFLDAIGESTLYKCVKLIPMGNLHLVITGKASIDEVFDTIKDGIQENKLYPYLMDAGEKYIEACRESQKVITELASKPETVELGDLGTIELPDEAALTAINSLLDTASLPSLEDIFVNVSTEVEAKVEAINETLRANDERDSAKEEVERLQSELRKAAATSAAGGREVVIEHDGTIPSGKMVVKPASELFPGVPLATDFDLPCWEWDGLHPDVPQKDEHYIFRPEQLTRVLYAILTNQRAYLQGHTGAGKTTLIEQIAAHLNWPFIRINFDSEITRMDLIGRDTLSVDEEGRVHSQFVDGILPKVMSGAYMACFDEIDFVRPDVAYVMQAALEGNGLRITEDGDRLVKPHEMFRMFATGNTVGQGDEYGMYQGARPQSIALLDRFTVWLKVSYLTKDERLDLIKRKFPALKDEDVRIINQYTTEHLEAFASGHVIKPISPRGTLAIAQAMMVLGDIRQALEMTVLDAANRDDHQTLVGLIDRVLK